jgi:hypothetical protein
MPLGDDSSPGVVPHFGIGAQFPPRALQDLVSKIPAKFSLEFWKDRGSGHILDDITTILQLEDSRLLVTKQKIIQTFRGMTG